MLTKKQIEKEAAAYTNENNGSGFEFQAFIVGAEWADEQLESKIEAKQAVISGYQKMLSAKMAELSRLETEIHLRQETISGYQQVLAARTEALEAIIDRYEVANMLAGDDPVIEKAKKALEK